VYVEPSLHSWDEALHPWDETNFVVVYDHFDILLDSVCHFFIEDFCIDVH
jgi:hypothetical protein